MTIIEKQLGQARENSTNAVSVYSPTVSTRAIIKCITLCNTTTDISNFSIFIDEDGTTYDESTARYFDQPLPAKSTLQIDTYWAMSKNSGNLAYSTNKPNSITITVDGAEITDT